MASLEEASHAEGFWSNRQISQEVLKEMKFLKSSVEPFLKLESGIKDIDGILGMATPEDEHELQHFREEISDLASRAAELEFRALFSGEADPNNAIMNVNAGAGGTEACDWAAMLLRMYTLWAESKGYLVTWIDQTPGEEAGIKTRPECTGSSGYRRSIPTSAAIPHSPRSTSSRKSRTK
jgi:peptide chain release factor 2